MDDIIKINIDKLIKNNNNSKLKDALNQNDYHKVWDIIINDKNIFIGFLTRTDFLDDVTRELFENEILPKYKFDIPKMLYELYIMNRGDLIFSTYKYFDLNLVESIGSKEKSYYLGTIANFTMDNLEAYHWLEGKLKKEERMIYNFPEEMISILSQAKYRQDERIFDLARLDIIKEEMLYKEDLQKKAIKFISDISEMDEKKTVKFIFDKCNVLLSHYINSKIKEINHTIQTYNYSNHLITSEVKKCLDKIAKVIDYIDDSQVIDIKKFLFEDKQIYSYVKNYKNKPLIENRILKMELGEQYKVSKVKMKNKI